MSTKRLSKQDKAAKEAAEQVKRTIAARLTELRVATAA